MQIGIYWAFPDIRHFSLMFIPSLGKSRLKTVGKKNHDAAQPEHQMYYNLSATGEMPKFATNILWSPLWRI